jgi:hypothetical protein
MRRLLLPSILMLFVAAFAHAQCASPLSASGPTFNSTFLPDNGSAFGTASLTLRGTTATVHANTVGMLDTSTLTLMQGTTPLLALTDQSNMFRNGTFSRTLTLDPALAAAIAANPSSFALTLDTGRGLVLTSPLTISTGPVLTGRLTGSSGAGGNFLLSFGAPINQAGDVPISFDVVSNGAGNQFTSVQLLAGDGSPFFTFGNNLTANNGRVTGTVVVNSAFAQQLLANPCGLSFAINTTSGTPLTGTLSAGQEVFIPVAGSTPGLLGNRWKTDLNLFNSDVSGAGTSALVQFIPTGASLASASSTSTLLLPPRGGAANRDITTSMFNGMTGIGALRIISSGTVFANARVYDDQTANGKGTLGQSVPGLTRSQAIRSGVLVGLTSVQSGASGASAIGAQNARTNIGFFNPNDSPSTIAAELRDGNGSVIATQIVTLGPFQHTQMALNGANGLFASETSDFTGRAVTFLASQPLFAYASIVDNDSGDASFVLPQSME